MEVKICKNCKRLFNYIYGPELCHECSKLVSKEVKELNNKERSMSLKPMIAEDEEKYRQVKDFIMTHPKATVIQIAEENDITPMKLFEWIREDRLEFSEDSKHAWFQCESCGAKIKSGNLCNRCRIK